jgi:hypothetical protein
MADPLPAVLLRQRLRALRVLVAEARLDGVGTCAALLAEAEHLARVAEPAAAAVVGTVELDELIALLERTLGRDDDVLRRIERAAERVVETLRG